MRRPPVTLDDIRRWKTQGLGSGIGANYRPWIDVRCFSSKGRMSRPRGVTTGRMHHLFSDNEEYFFLMADFAASVVDIREQFPLFPESATQEIAKQLGARHPNYPQSHTPLVMTTDFLLTVVDKEGRLHFEAWSIKSANELRGRNRRNVLRKLEIERQYWQRRGVLWRLFTDNDFNPTVIDNLDWLSYLTVDYDPDLNGYSNLIPVFLTEYEIVASKPSPLKDQLRDCASKLGRNINTQVALDLFRHCVWHHLINLDLSVPIGLQRTPAVLSVRSGCQPLR